MKRKTKQNPQTRARKLFMKEISQAQKAAILLAETIAFAIVVYLILN